MKRKPETINQSRTWAAALCADLERTWKPSEALLLTYDIWFKAVRECRFLNGLKVFARYRCSKSELQLKRDRALRDLLGEPPRQR